MKKCDLTREELISSVKEKVNKEFMDFKNQTIMERSLTSFWNNAGVIYEYTILHHYIMEMAETFTNKQLRMLDDSETLESLVDVALGKLPQKNAESCKSTLNKFFENMEDSQDGGLE